MSQETMAMDEGWVEVKTELEESVDIGPTETRTFEGVHRGRLPDWRKTPIASDDISNLYDTIQRTARDRLISGQPIFRTEIGQHDIADVFIGHLPSKHQQEMRCGNCLRFMRRFGSLAMIESQTGNLVPLFWNASGLQRDSIFYESVSAVNDLFLNKKAGREFEIEASVKHIGRCMAGGFAHMYFEFPAERVVASPLAGFDSAATEELASMLDRVLGDNDAASVNYVAKLLLQDKLPHASEHKASIKWLRDLIESNNISSAKSPIQRHNLLFFYATSAFVGCIKQLRSGSVSTILADVKAGMNFKEITRRWKALVNPSVYMRPQAAPGLGQIAAAESLFLKLGLTDQDMRRKYLTPAEIPSYAFLYGQNETTKPIKKGLFGNLVPKETYNAIRNMNLSAALPMDEIPATTISFFKLVNEILPGAKMVEYMAPEVSSVYFFITGLHGTKPLMQFHDSENLVSWYTNCDPVRLLAKRIHPGWTQVDGILAFPHLWPEMKETGIRVPGSQAEQEAYRHKRHGIRYLVQLHDIIENNQQSLCLFPTLLKTELHGVRSTIEAYSNKGKTEHAIDETGAMRPFVGGIEISQEDLSRAGHENKHLFRVTDADGDIDTFEIGLFA